MYKEFDPMEDYSGKQFCHIRLDFPINVSKTGKKLMYSCTCMKCGKTGLHYWGKDVHDYKQRSCGCTDFRDLSEGVFGNWVAKDCKMMASQKFQKPRRVWRCVCSCPDHNEKLIKVDSLTSGRSTSCGCLKSPSIIGMHFGMLTVVREEFSRNNGGGRMFLCKCKCGKEVVVERANLMSRHTTSCGSCAKVLDLTGKKYGLLTPLYILPPTRLSGSSRMWHCRCDCGREVDVSSHSLVCRHTSSCGCTEHRKKYHTEEEVKLASVRGGMIQRCYNQNSPAYAFYGARGIRVCDEWLDPETGTTTFINWASTHGYKQGLSIDRINVNGPYAPENCRWTTAKIQLNNTTRTRFMTIDGKTQSVTLWVEEVDGGTALAQTLCYIHRVMGEKAAVYIYRLYRSNPSDKRYLMAHPI